jgi:predicted membrane protein
LKLLFKTLLLVAVILLLYATTLTEPHSLVFWRAFVDSQAFFWSLVITLAVVGAMLTVYYHHALKIKTKSKQADQLLSQAQAAVTSQKDTLAELKRNLDERYHLKEEKLQAEYDRLKEPYLKKIKELKSQNIALKETAAKLMQALKEKKPGR